MNGKSAHIPVRISSPHRSASGEDIQIDATPAPFTEGGPIELHNLHHINFGVNGLYCSVEPGYICMMKAQ